MGLFFLRSAVFRFFTELRQVNSVQLQRASGGWKIMSMAFTRGSGSSAHPAKRRLMLTVATILRGGKRYESVQATMLVA
ncbi:MAG: hypothetical protein ABJC63_12630 [Gemmatimonadales bacterium]